MKTRCSDCRNTRRRVVWMVDRKPLCNMCYSRWVDDCFDILTHRVDRLTMDEQAFIVKPYKGAPCLTQ